MDKAIVVPSTRRRCVVFLLAAAIAVATHFAYAGFVTEANLVADVFEEQARNFRRYAAACYVTAAVVLICALGAAITC